MFNGVPVILAHTSAPLDDGAGEAQPEWAPADGVERFAYTSLTTVGAAVGFTLILIALMLLAGEQITLATGLAWGACAFVAIGLGPAFGLAPELPGAATADVVARQTWWMGTVVATGAGLACLLRSNSALIGLAGVVLIALPHVIGAPHPHELASKVPAELAAQFTAQSIGLQAVLWALIGGGIGALWARGDAKASAA